MDDQLSRPGTDRRAKGAVSLIDGGTPLPESSVVYFAREKSAAADQWAHITSQENLAAVKANPEQFELMTLFTVPVADLARAPIAHLARAREVLDQIERRTAVIERRAADRHPGETLQWEDEFDVLAMKADFNDLQAAVEHSQKSSLNFMQIRTDLGAQAVRYIKYLTELAGRAQDSKSSSAAGADIETLAGQDWKAPIASQSQAVPSELASLAIVGYRIDYADGRRSTTYSQELVAKSIADNNGGTVEALVRLSDVQSLFSHSAATGKAEAVAAMNRAKALKAWDCIPHALHVELDTIFKYLASPAAPLAGKAEQDAADIDRFWNKAIDAEAEASRLREENAALRAALKKITETPTQCVRIADAALAIEN